MTDVQVTNEDDAVPKSFVRSCLWDVDEVLDWRGFVSTAELSFVGVL